MILQAIAPLAQGDCNILNLSCPNAPGGAFIAGVILDFVPPLIFLANIITVAALVYGGYAYVTSTGDQEKGRRAKVIIMYAIIGLVIVNMAGFVVNAVVNLG